MLIGRLGGLTVLNGGEVKARSRDDAERFYLRQALQALPEGGLPAALLEALPQQLDSNVRLDAEAIEAQAAALPVPEGEAWRALEALHPRWRRLLVKHGEQRAVAGAVAGGGGTLAAELIELTIRSTAADSQHLAPQVRRLPSPGPGPAPAPAPGPAPGPGPDLPHTSTPTPDATRCAGFPTGCRSRASR